MSWAFQPLLPATKLLEDTPPSVVLNSPADTANTGDLTPTLNFTGTDAQSDEVEYNVQVHTDSAFRGSPSITNLTSGESTSGATSYATASISATANQLVLLSASTRTGITADPNEPTASGGGLTWVVVGSTVYDDDSSSRRRITLFRALGASPSAGAITIDYAGQSQTEQEWSINQVSNVDTSGTNGSGAIVQSATNRATDSGGLVTSLTVTLPSTFEDTSNVAFGCFANADSSWTRDVGSGFTSLSDSTTALINGHLTEWKNSNDTTVDITFSSQSGVGGVAVEIKSSPPLIDAYSATDAGFTAGNPYPSGDATDYTVQSDLTASTTYYWRVRAIDPAGSNSYGAWASTRSFTATEPGGSTTFAGYIHGGNGWY